MHIKEEDLVTFQCLNQSCATTSLVLGKSDIPYTVKVGSLVLLGNMLANDAGVYISNVFLE